ncbi:MAG: phosphopentomutase [Lachnospiraceae bacterium]|jgi:phosphopentomutase|nr:phosphopentomutase [Lachnospiraceae bacterium]
MNRFDRIFVVVVDSLGIGAMPDAPAYGDAGADTLGHIDQTVPHLHLPNLAKLGLGDLGTYIHIPPAGCTPHSTDAVSADLGAYIHIPQTKASNSQPADAKPAAHIAPGDACASGPDVHATTSIGPAAYVARLHEASLGKDTMTGHWEMMGLYITKPFITFTDTGFPQELLDELSRRTGHGIVGNRAESGTVIMEELGEHHIATGDMIVYTSADSVLQICANEDTFGLDELYRCCEIARELTMKDEWKVGRIIARPFVGLKKGEFRRTSNRRDYALKPFGVTALDLLKENALDVIAVGKIHDIFDGQGITVSYHSDSSVHGMEQTIEIAKTGHSAHPIADAASPETVPAAGSAAPVGNDTRPVESPLPVPASVAGSATTVGNGQSIDMESPSDGMHATTFRGLCFTNLVDFDALWGHRRNPVGYGEELERFDVKLGELLPLLGVNDLLIITADHGNDPTFHGTDHTREMVPFLAYSPSFGHPVKLPDQGTFAVVGQTILENFGIAPAPGMIGQPLQPAFAP